MAFSDHRTRLCLVTPPDPDRLFAEALRAALAAGDVATLIIDTATVAADRIPEITAVAAGGGAAVVLVGGVDLTEADGTQIETGAEGVRAMRQRYGTDKIIGAAAIRSRHDAMTLGEALPDYLFFGRIEGDDGTDIHPKALELAAWWSELFEIPAIVMGGSGIDSAGTAAVAGIEFVALRGAVWDYPAGPCEAVARANSALELKSRS